MRRRALLQLAVLGLSGCGFSPLYETRADGKPNAVQSDLAAIEVPILPDRNGQLMRQALQQRLDGPGYDIPKRYRLIVGWGIAAEGLVIEPDSSVSRVRLNGSGSWTLVSLAPNTPVLANGTSRALDGYNPISNQSFAADEETEAITRRMADRLADQIVQQVAAYFAKQTPATVHS